MTTQTSRRIGIREFRDNASQVVREVRQTGEEVIITVDGVPAAVLRPITSEDAEAQLRAEDDARWDRLMALAAEVASAWPEGVTAVDAVREQRR